MTKLEKAICYLCNPEIHTIEVQAKRYRDIERMIKGDNDLIEKYAKQYEKLLDVLCF